MLLLLFAAISAEKIHFDRKKHVSSTSCTNCASVMQDANGKYFVQKGKLEINRSFFIYYIFFILHDIPSNRKSV